MIYTTAYANMQRKRGEKMAKYSDLKVHKTVVLYTTGCPKCKVLKAKLDAKGIQYEENGSVNDMKELGITNVPMLKCDGWLMDFKSAVEWVNEQ